MEENKGFDFFVKKICAIPHPLADGHFRSQYYLIYGISKVPIVDYIGKFENLERDIESLNEKFNLGKLAHLNPSTKKNWMDYYSMKSAKLVYKKYKKDIIAFGYEKEYKHLLEYLTMKNLKQER